MKNQASHCIAVTLAGVIICSVLLAGCSNVGGGGGKMMTGNQAGAITNAKGRPVHPTPVPPPK